MTLNDFVFSLIHKLLVLLNFLMTNSLAVFLFWLDLSSMLCMKSLRLLYRYHVFRHSWWTQYKSQQGTRNLPTLVELWEKIRLEMILFRNTQQQTVHLVIVSVSQLSSTIIVTGLPFLSSLGRNTTTLSCSSHFIIQQIKLLTSVIAT